MNSLMNGSVVNLVDSRACTKPDKKCNMTNSQLWFRGVRPSKFRHVYGLPSRKESCYTDVSVVRNGNDGNFCAINPQLLAIVADTTFVVIPVRQTGRIDFQCCKVIGHTGQILDLKWSPFDDNVIASASDDCSIRVWKIPSNGLTSNLDESQLELNGHMRKVLIIEWHPTAKDVLFSAGFDHVINVWDLTDGGRILQTISCHTDMIHSMAINRDGSLIATTSKDRRLRVIEPRTAIVVADGVCHESTKCSKVTFLDGGRVLTTGFSRHSDRQFAIWDQHDLKRPLTQEVMDSSSGVVTPFFDYDTRMLYLAGKGDGNIRYYEVVDEAPYIHYLNQFLSGQPQKTLGFMPKRGISPAQCEVFRFYKLHATGNICEPISMIVPRKSTLFQSDLYPDTLSAVPATTVKEWLQGRNVQPNLMSMQTGHSVDKNVTPATQVAQPSKTTCIANKPNVNNNANATTNGHAVESNKPAQQNGNGNAAVNNAKYAATQNGGQNNNNVRTKEAKLVGNNNEECNKENDNKYDNNSKKFAFLAQQTIPDYRQVDCMLAQQLTDKGQKTSSNQTTKFHKLQAIFGHQGANNKDLANLQNNLLSGSTASSRNSSMENISLINGENELRKAFCKQVEEIRNLKNKLANADKRVQELEAELSKLRRLSSEHP